jgi:hypothetical protein
MDPSLGIERLKVSLDVRGSFLQVKPLVLEDLGNSFINSNYFFFVIFNFLDF